jgi:hypothetical protein
MTARIQQRDPVASPPERTAWEYPKDALIAYTPAPLSVKPPKVDLSAEVAAQRLIARVRA